MTRVFTLTKRGLLWRSAHPELAGILKEVWLSWTLRKLESFIEKRTLRERVSKMDLIHKADRIIQNTLLLGSQEEINRISIKISTDIDIIIAHLHPKDLSSTTNGRSKVGSGGFAKVIRAILDTCKQELEESNSAFLERSLRFNWKNTDWQTLRGSVQSNKSNLGIIPNLPDSFWLYVGLVALGENAGTMNIGGHGKGTTVGAMVKKALRAIHCEG